MNWMHARCVLSILSCLETWSVWKNCFWQLANELLRLSNVHLPPSEDLSRPYVQYLISVFVFHIMFSSMWNVPCAQNDCESGATKSREKQKNISQMLSPGMMAHLNRDLFCIHISSLLCSLFLYPIVNGWTVVLRMLEWHRVPVSAH